MSACQKETFSVPPDEVFDPSSTKLRDAVIEFDAMSGFNATDDFTFTPSYNEYEIMVRKHYSSTVTGIGGQVNIIGVADQTNMPQPEQEGFTDLFSNLDSRQLRMLQYAARQRQKNPTNSVLLSYMYHFLSVDSNNYPASPPIGGVILGVSSVQGENVPQDAVNRASFLFVDDLRRWASTNNVSRKNSICIVT